MHPRATYPQKALPVAVYPALLPPPLAPSQLARSAAGRADDHNAPRTALSGRRAVALLDDRCGLRWPRFFGQESAKFSDGECNFV